MQASLQAAVRQVTGSKGTFTEDLHAFCDYLGVPPAQLMERLGRASGETPQFALNWFLRNGVQGVIPWSPSDLFATGAPGLWYDLSLTDGTLFQDAAETLPVTAVEQPVGLMLDKSKGLVLGPELVTNGDFSDGLTGWTSINTGTGTATTSVVNGQASLQTFVNGDVARLRQSFTTVVGKVYKVTVGAATGLSASGLINFGTTGGGSDYFALGAGASAGTRYITATSITLWISAVVNGVPFTLTFDNISVRELPGNHAFQTTSANRPVLSARYNLLTKTETLATQSIATLATAYTLRFEGAGSITLSGTATGTYTAGVYSVPCAAGTLTATVSGSVTKADFRPANDGVGLPPYQRVNTATDYDTVGFPLYLRFNGSTQFLQTNPIDFSSTDKVFVSAGVRKLSDSTRGMVVELGNTANYWFHIDAPSTAGAGSYSFKSQGTSLATAVVASGYSSPLTNVLTGFGNISDDSAILRANSTQVAQSTADQGTGSFGNYPLYIGASAGTLFFNGRLYSLIIAGIKPTDAQILGVETYINRLARAF